MFLKYFPLKTPAFTKKKEKKINYKSRDFWLNSKKKIRGSLLPKTLT